MKNKVEKNGNKWPSTNRMLFLIIFSILIVLSVVSGYLFLENQHLGKRLTNATHEADILDAEVPDPVIKYAPLLVNPDDAGIKKLAASLGSPEEIYLFVRDRIDYSEEYDQHRSAVEVLEKRQGDCLGKSDLLASLLLANGYPTDEVSVSMGYVTRNGERLHHAWVEFRNNGKWMVLDSSKFLWVFGFDRWDRGSFYKMYNAEPYAEFNDRYVHVNLNNSTMSG